MRAGSDGRVFKEELGEKDARGVIRLGPRCVAGRISGRGNGLDSARAGQSTLQGMHATWPAQAAAACASLGPTRSAQKAVHWQGGNTMHAAQMRYSGGGVWLVTGQRLRAALSEVTDSTWLLLSEATRLWSMSLAGLPAGGERTPGGWVNAARLRMPVGSMQPGCACQSAHRPRCWHPT